jgi:hypothetical protein
MTTPKPLRRLFFQVMLWSLGAAAVAGFFAVLTASYDVVGRVAATAFATAVAAGIMWRLEALLDDDAKSVSGLLGMASTGICFLLSLLGIWAGEEDEWRWWVTICALAMTTPVAMGCLQLIAKGRELVAGLVGLAFSGIVLVLWLIPIWIATTDYAEWSATVAVVAGYAALATLCLISVSRSVRDAWRWAGVAAAAMGCLVSLQAIWDRKPVSDSTLDAVTVLVSVASVVAHANLTFLVPLRASQVWIRWATIASAVLTAGTIDAIAVFDWHSDTLAARFAGALAIVAVCGSLALAVLARYNKLGESTRPASPEGIDPAEIEKMTVVCPCCELQQTVPLGGAQCPKCALEIDIRVQAAKTVPGE